MRCRGLVIVFALLATSALPSNASARPACDDIQSTAAADQYCEVLPGADGQGLEAQPGSRLDKELPPHVVERLERSGMLGHTLLSMPSGIDPKALHGRGPSLEVSDIVGDGRLAPASGAAPGRRVLGAVESTSDATNGLFGIVLLGSAITLGGVAWMRRRTYPGA